MRIVLISIVTGACMALGGVQPWAAELQGEAEKVAYSVGYQVGGDFRRQGLELDPDLVVMGVMDALSKIEPAMTAAQMREALHDLQVRANEAAQARRRSLARANLKEGRKYLQRNAKRGDVVVLDDGVQYEILRPGSGPAPAPDGRVTVHYQGTLLDGRVFDSSYRRSEPSTFQVDRTIAGWRKVLALMKEGAKWRVVVPAELGYGEKGVGDEIPPNATLLFDIELIAANVP
jgi:FKBP-type peptidyl-prolyl cis-trans isomerase FklB